MKAKWKVGMYVTTAAEGLAQITGILFHATDFKYEVTDREGGKSYVHESEIETALKVVSNRKTPRAKRTKTEPDAKVAGGSTAPRQRKQTASQENAFAN